MRKFIFLLLLFSSVSISQLYKFGIFNRYYLLDLESSNTVKVKFSRKKNEK